MSINSMMSGFATANNMTFDKDTLSIFGKFNGRNICIIKSANGNLFEIIISAKIGDLPPTVDLPLAFPQLKVQSNNRIATYRVEKNRIVFTTKQVVFVAGLLKDIYESVQAITNYLNTNGYVDCCGECQSAEALDTSIINGNAHILCDACYGNVVSALEQNKQIIKAKKGNLLTGIVGAFIGSLIGVIVFVLIGQLGYIAAISGIVMAVCTLKGYELLGGKISIAGVISSCVIMAIMVWFSTNLDLSIAISTEFEMSVFDSFKLLPQVLGMSSELEMAYFGDLLIAYLLTAVGAVPTIISLFKAKTGQYRSKRLTQTQPAYQPTAGYETAGYQYQSPEATKKEEAKEESPIL